MKARPLEPSPQEDLFPHRLDNLIDLQHPLAHLAERLDWAALDASFGEFYADGESGQPPKATRLMCGLLYLKHTYALSDEPLVERWMENPYYQYFCGET